MMPDTPGVAHAACGDDDVKAGQLGDVLPGALQVAAKALGMTTQQLDKAVSSGQVLASDLLPKMAKELHEAGAKLIVRV